jgi:uncharacterized protein YegJ (DUF2314 family)
MIETAYGVVLAKGSDVGALEKRARSKGYEVDRAPSSATIADVFSDEQLSLVTKHLSADDVAGLKSPGGILMVTARGTDGLAVARDLGTLTRDIATAGKGWVIDFETFEIHTAAAFADHIVTSERPDVRKLIVVHGVMGENQMPFLDTGGFSRFGFPALYVREASPAHVSQITHLINGVAQSLLDGGDVSERSELAIDFKKLGWDVGIIEKGTGKAVLTLRWAKEADADADEPLVVELIPPGGRGPEHWAALITECFGAVQDKVASIPADDPELVAAGKRARTELTKLRAHFAKGIPPGEDLTVKARFTGPDDAVEWMWVHVVAFKGTTFEGTLGNEPVSIPNLREGQKVKVKLADVADYLHEVDGASPTGGYSIEVMRKRGYVP